MSNNAVVGQKIKQFRLLRGLARRAVASRLQVDVTAVSAWENGEYLPRGTRRATLAKLLECSVEDLFSDAEIVTSPISVRTIDTMTQLGALLPDLVKQTTYCLKALRIAAPYSTPAHVQHEFRSEVSRRLLQKEIEVQRVEIFYTLDRLKETLFNIFHYDGCRYVVKSYCSGLKEVAPAIGGYFFDESRFLIGAYWTGVPPHDQPGLLLSGEPFAIFFKAYWNEIWRRGTLLNIKGCHDLSAIREVALALGLPARDWPRFVEDARQLEVGDGAPPLV